MISRKKNVWPIWPGDGVLTAHDIQEGECVAIWPGDGVLTAHDIGEGECVAKGPVSEYLLPMISEKEIVSP
ncbi:hypothetical protein BgiBS90_015887 [Biomphalaria glabrata]|nr:hypothetical protein BgiBS90_015887 [Biomphalaria glabrata]